MKGKLISILFTFLIVSIAAAGGFELYEFGAASSALSGAVVARSWLFRHRRFPDGDEPRYPQCLPLCSYQPPLLWFAGSIQV